MIEIPKDSHRKKSFSQIRKIKKDSHKKKRFSQAITNKNQFSMNRLSGVYVNSIVNDVIRTISRLFTLFLRKNFKHAKTQIKQKPTNKRN